MSNSAVQDTLVAALGKIAGTRRAVMLSGGFDSMLMASLALQCKAKVTAVTVQFDDFNPRTVADSTKLADQLGIAHHILHVKAVEFLAAFEAIAGITEEPLLDLDLAVVYAALKKYDHRIAGRIFISGMGSDQWFGDEALQVPPGGVEENLKKAKADQDAHQRVAQAHGCQFIFPFLSKPMLSLSQSIPPAMKKDKKLLRALVASKMIPHGGGKSEVQVPRLMRRALIKTYGSRAWPSPVSIPRRGIGDDEPLLRQIVQGLWLEKTNFISGR